MGVARASRRLGIDAATAFEMWVDPRRWPDFVDGFGHIEHVDETWPAAGAEIDWHSVPGGRGRVVERVRVCERPSLFQTEVAESALTGTQTVEFRISESGDAVAVLSIDYTLSGGGPLRRLTDALFIRRAQAESLERTLARFAAEARGQAEL